MAGDEVHITLTEYENEKLESLAEAITRPLTSDKPLIQEVTHMLPLCYTTEECKRYFEPTYVTLGPLSNGKWTTGDSSFKRGEECKRRLAAMFIKLANGTTKGFYKDVKREIDILKNCYNFEGQEWNDEELAFMFLVDGCALLNFILLDVDVEWKELIGTDDLIGIERADFFLLKNQLPYRLLEILINSFAEWLGTGLSSGADPSSGADLSSGADPSSGADDKKEKEKVEKFFKKSINEFINRICLNLTSSGADLSSGADNKKKKVEKFFKKSINEFINRIYLNLTARVDHSEPHHPCEQQQEEVPVHLLDLLRRRLMGVKSKEKGEKQNQICKNAVLIKMDCDNDKSNQWQSNRNVTELKGKGIRFKAREKEGAITDVDFSDRCFMRTFKLVPISLHNTTMPILLNLIAYELCPDFKETCDITSYLSFLDSLVHNGEDVKELIDAGVLHNGLGSYEAAAELLKKFSGILVPDFGVASELRHNIDKYCNSNKSHFMEVIHIYFRGTWSFWVFLSALAGLIMQGMQTYYSSRGNKLP